MQWGLQEGATTQTQEEPQHTTECFLRRVLHQEPRRQRDVPLQTSPPRVLPLRTQPLTSTERREPYRRLWRWTRLHRDGRDRHRSSWTPEERGRGAGRVCVWGDEVPGSGWYGVPHWPSGMSFCMPNPSTLRPWTSQSLLHTSKHSPLWHSCTLSQFTHPSASTAGVPAGAGPVLTQLGWVSSHPSRCNQITHAGEPILQQIPHFLQRATFLCTHPQGAHCHPNPHRVWSLICASPTLYPLQILLLILVSAQPFRLPVTSQHGPLSHPSQPHAYTSLWCADAISRWSSP